MKQPSPLFALTAFVLCVLVSRGAAQPRGARDSRPQESPKTTQQAQDDQQIRTQRALDAIAVELRAIREQAAQIEQQRSERESEPGPPIWSNWILIIVTGAAVSVAFSTLGALRRQVDSNIEATKAAQVSAAAAKASADAGLLAERAYVTISHKPPGVEIDDMAVTGLHEEQFGGWRTVAFRFEIRNHGNTPATVTDVAIGHFVRHPADLPPPPTGPGTGEHLFLVKGDTAHDDRTFQITDAETEQLGLTLRLWVLGYVDYIDAFGVRRRSGYARFYDRHLDTDRPIGLPDNHPLVQKWAKRNNLAFVTQPGYNYDRERQPGEGNDWNQA